ncbi:MAG TPA: hypothetical protein PL077_00690, partial [Treponemataceae bacterium]|nr:hypothetical protein [Treponemataceae bacterium]
MLPERVPSRASHEPLLSGELHPGVRVCALDPRDGFESFISEIHSTIKQNGRGGCYVFDLLSELTS